MNIIIDANNLAGSLGILNEEKFDLKLIQMIEKYNQGKSREISLVFDGVDFMGDSFEVDNNVIIICTPKDNYYKNADDKIVEIVKNNLQKTDHKIQVLIVTDDIELQKRVINEYKKYNEIVFLEKSSEFKIKLLKKIKSDNNKFNKKNIKKEDFEEFNRELLSIWQ